MTTRGPELQAQLDTALADFDVPASRSSPRLVRVDPHHAAIIELPAASFPSTRLLPRGDVLGVPVDLADRASWVATVQRWIRSNSRGTAVGINAHVVNLARRDPAFAAWVSESDFAYADGQSVVWAAQALGWPLKERLATTDLIEPLCMMLAAEGHPLYLYGGQPGVAEAAAAQLAARHEGLQIAGTQHGFLPIEEHERLVQEINASGARALLVGLGEPRQQAWVARHRADLRPAAVLTCGGLFDWVSGNQPRPPDWVPAAGLEWIWRLWLEPRRLARRYLVGNPLFVAALARALFARRLRY